LAACKKAGYFFIADVNTPNFFSNQLVCEGGVIILSRFQIVEQEFMPFSYSIDGEGQSELGAIYAKIKIPSDSNSSPKCFNHIKVFNVHT